MKVTLTGGLKWFGQSRAVTAGITIVGATLLAAGCSPVEAADVTPPATDSSAEATSTPTASPSVEASAPTEIAEADYVEYEDGMELIPGVKVTDPNGGIGKQKPDFLTGTSAYYKDGAWYVFDPADGFPEYVQETYLKVDKGQSTDDFNTQMSAAVNDLVACFAGVNVVNESYRSNILWWDYDVNPHEGDATWMYDSLNSLTLSGWMSADAPYLDDEDAAVQRALDTLYSHTDEVNCPNVDNIPRIYSEYTINDGGFEIND